MSELFIEDGIRLRVADDQEERAAMERFIREQAFASYGCEPPPSPGPIIGAWKDDRIVGSVALTFREALDPFPLEELYEPAVFGALFPEGFDRTIIAEAGRWFSALRGSSVSQLLLRAMGQYARARGRRVILGEAKEYAIELFGKFGYPCVWIETSNPNIRAVPETGRRYYEIPPLPHLFRIDL